MNDSVRAALQALSIFQRKPSSLESPGNLQANAEVFHLRSELCNCLISEVLAVKRTSAEPTKVPFRSRTRFEP